MNLRQAREQAVKMDTQDKVITFTLVDQKERTQRCAWVNPREGTFFIEGNTGFCRVDDFAKETMQVINIKLEG